MIKPEFYLPNFNTYEKELSIGDLGAVTLTVDYDDVDHEQINELLPLIVEALNNIPQRKINVAIKRAHAKDMS